VLHCREEALELLISSGANFNKLIDNGSGKRITPLQLAEKQGDFKIIEILKGCAIAATIIRNNVYLSPGKRRSSSIGSLKSLSEEGEGEGTEQMKSDEVETQRGTFSSRERC